MTTDTITLIANVSLSLSFIVALVFGIAQVISSSRDRRERTALEWLRNFQSREFAEMLHYIIAHDAPKNFEELNALPEKEQVIFIQLSQQFESLGLLVAGNLISADLVDRTLGSFVTTVWEKYKPLFLSIRRNDPYMAEYFQWLAEKIQKQNKEHPRKPYYEA